jgi:tripartite ATP-independent transporter DctP family solute receptor
MRIKTTLLLVLLLACGTARAAETVIYLAHQNNNNPKGTLTAAAAVAFKNAAEKLSKGALRVEIFPEGQLGGDAKVLDLVKSGKIQSGISSVGAISKIYSLVGVLDFPFVWHDLEETYAVFDGPFGKRLEKDFSKKTGLGLLGLLDTGGFFLLTNAKRRIKNPADLKSVRIRTMSLDSHRIFIKSIGGEPVSIAWSNLVNSLRNQIVDGQMNPASIIRYAQLDNVQRYVTLTNHLYTPYFWVVNREFMAGLSDEQRKIVASAARAGIEANRWESLDQSVSHETFLRRQMDVYTPTAKERKAFQQAAQPAMRRHIADKLGKEGTELLDSLLKSIETVRRKRGGK